MDNTYAERLWRNLKQEEVYRRTYETVAEAQKGIAGHLGYFNEEYPPLLPSHFSTSAFFD